MQIDMHGVNAEIAGTHSADNGVEIGTIAVKIGACSMGQARDLDDVALKQAAGIGIRHHDGGNILAQLGRQIRHIDTTVFRLGHFLDRITYKSSGRRVGAMGRGRYQHSAAMALPLSFVRGLDRQ